MKNNYKFGICSRRNLGSWWMGVMSLMLVTMLWSSIASAQTAAINGTTYPMTSSTGASFQDSTGGTAVLFSSNDDTPSGLISFGSGFTFQFAGRFYTGFSVSPDGFIRLGSAGIGQFTNDLTSNTNVPIIAAYWDDLATGTDGYAKYKLSGVAPNRIAIFDWFVTIPRNTGGPANSRIQMSLFESTGQIEFVYGGHTDALANYSVGVRDTIAGVGQFASLTCAQPITSTTASYVLANNANTTAFVAGDKITFTPPAAPASPTSLSFSAVTVNSMTLDWADATGEIGYVVERSLDGITYTRVAVLGANAISYTASGLTASQTYYWNVRSLSEGQMSDPALNGNQATAAGIVCGTFSVGPTGTYATITAALNDIRTNGLSCSAILELQAAYTSGGETFPIWTGGLGTVASKTVTIRPELGAVALSITSANSWTTVLDSLTEYLTIDGRPGGAGVVSELTIQNTVLTGSAMRILQESSNNNFSYINFRGSSNTVANGVVFMGGSTIVGGSGNDNNTFDNCDIHEAGTLFPVNCFISTGTASASNDNNTISNCRIYNFYSATLATVGINVGAGNVSMTITGNRIYQDASRNYTTGNIHKGIVANNTLSSFTITNNIIGYASSSGTGTYSMTWATTAIANRFFGMDLNVAISPVSTISGNEIASFNITTNSSGTGSGAPFCGIWLNAGGANITGNTVGSMTGTDNILVRGTVTGGSATTANVIGIAQGAASASSISISNNNIGGLGFNGITAAFANAAAIGGTVCGIFNQGTTTLTVATSNRTISGNTIGGTGIANSMRSGNALNAGFTTTVNFSVVGILNTGSTRMTISNNTVQNLRVPTRSSAGVVYGISTTTGINTISGNTIKILSSNAKNVAAANTAHLSGINHASTTVPVAGTEVNISGNTIFDLKMSADTGRVVVNGIAYTGTTTVGFNQLIQKNLIYDLNDLTTASDTAKHVFIGIGLYGGLPTVQNNMIQVGLGNTRSQDYYGIYKANTNINKIYHNSVYVGGDASVASGVLQGNTYGFRRVNRPTTGNDEIINNIFYNARTSAVGGLQYAIALDSNINVTSSKNVLFADFANGGRTGIRNLTVASSLTDWRTLTGLDLNSISENPNYIAPAASTPDLHIQPSPAVTPVESAGLAIAGPADDFDGQSRAGFTPIDIGADAGDFVASGDFLSPTIISVVASPAGSACAAASRLVSVDASDASGILSVDLNWSLNGVAQTAIVMVFNGGTNLWEGTIPTSGNALVSFSATATDNSVNLNATTSASQSYRDEYLFAGLSAGVDQTICPGTSTNLSVASPYLNSIVFSEISGFETGTGAGPLAPGISGFDYIELTNIGNQPVDISGWKLETTGIAGSYIIPAGNTVAAGGTFTIARGGGGAAIPGVYVNSTLVSQGSATAQGFIISDLGGNISDVAAIMSHNPVGLGTPAVTAAMWSGNVASSSGTAGIRRTAFSDSNTAADWTVASAGNLTNWGAFNVGLGNILVANISWSSGGTGSIENVTPVASPTEYVVTLNDGVCTATDTVVVSWFTTLPAPVGVDSMHCGNQQAKCDIFSVPGATAYRWYTTPTGGTPVQNTIDTNLLVNVATTTTFYVAAFDGVCDGPRVAVTETVVQPDPIDIVSVLGSSICLGEVDTLDVVQTGSTNTYLYTWSGDGVGTLNVNSGAQVISTPTAGGVYTFVVLGDDAAAGCVITDTLILTVNNNPVVSTNISSATLCLGDSVALTSSAYVVEGATGTPPTYLPSTATNPADEEILNVTFGSINQSSTCATTGTGPGSVLNLYSNYTDIAPAIVAPGQSVPFSVTVGYCGLTAYSNTMNIYIDWNQDGDFLDLDELAFAKPYGAAALTGTAYTGNILVPLTALGGSTRLRVVLVESTVISPTGTYTWGETEDYSILVASQSGLTYSWAPAAGLSDPNISNPMATPAVTTTYVLTVEKTATGCSTTANVQIDVLPVPNTPTTNNSAHCGNQIPTASVDPVAGATAYYWYDAAVGGNILQADPSLTFLSSVGTTTTMYVAAFDGSCYSSRAAITITVSTPPAIIASADDSTVCLGSTIALSSTANGYTDFAWSVNGNGNLLTNNTQNVNATPTSAGSYNYIVTVSGGTGPNLGCVTSDTVEVEVFNLPTVISINIADTTLCQGQATSVVVNAIPSSVTTGPQTPPSGYLASNATNTIDEDINGVTIATLNNTQTAPNCATYTDFTSLPATDLTAGSTYPISISITDCELSGFFSAGTAVYIDYNRDGDFLDVNELAYTNNITINGPHIVNGSITVPLTAVAGVTRMRVVNTEGSLIPTSTGTYGYGETEDYLVNVSSFVPTLTYSWSPAGDFSDPSAANTSYIGSSVGANVITVTILDTVSGCSNTANRTIYVDPVPAAPVCAGDTICGQGDVTLTATGSLNELFWTEGNGGNILAVNDTLVQNVSASGSFQVREFPNNLDTTAVGYDPILYPSAPAGYFPTTAQGMWFRVDNASGTIIKSVDIYPNGPIGTPYGIEIIDSLGNTIGSVSGVTTVTLPNYETIEINIFVPYSTIPYAMRPTSSPNLAVHQNATVSGTSPWVIAGEMTIIAYGNMPPLASYFGATTFGMFYNWQVMHGCFGSSCIADYVVNPAPALSITAGGPTTFCGNGSVSLDASALPTDPSYVNFSWSPATGLNTTTGGIVTASVSTTTTYTVTADDGIVGGCANSATITITVNTAPFADAGVVPDTICTTAPYQFNGSGGSASYKYVGTTENLGQTAGWPFNGANAAQRMQLFVSAAELNAAGVFGPSFINSVGFNVVSKLSNQPYTNFTVDIDEVVGGCFASTTYIAIPGGNTVYTGNYSTSVGWNDLVFQTPYAWDGVSDIVIQTCFTNATNSLFDIVYTSQTLGCTSTNALNAAACGAATGALTDFRPNLRFQGGSVNYSWSPITELSASNIANPIFTQSLGVGSRQYVLTVTDPVSGCTATDTANFYVSPTPVTPSIEFTGLDTTICISGTVSFSSIFVDGSLQWQSSSDNVSFFDIIGETGSTLTTGLLSSDTYIRLKAFCADSAYSNVKYVKVNNPQIVSTVNDTVCGQGNVTLEATANPGYFIRWYADSTAGNYLANGSPYNTFVTQTDTFWVAALVDTLVGSGGDTLTTTFAGGNGSSGNFFDVNVVSPVSLTGMRINNGTAGAICEVWYRSGTHVGFEGSSAGWTQIFNGPVAAAQGYVEGLNLPLSSGVTSFFVFLPAGGMTYTNGVSLGAVYASDANLAILEGYGTGGTFGSGLFGGIPTSTRIWNGSLIYAVPNCVSARVPVIAVVNPAPPVTVSPTAATICEGSSVNINVVGGTGDYTNFDWAPAAGLDVTSGTAVVASPSVTTSYIVTATGNIDGCVTSDTAVITVNPAPVFTLSPSSQNLCNGDTAAVSVVVTAPVSGNYSVVSIPHTPSAATLTQSAPALGDEGNQNVALPFTFNFGGTNYTDVTIHSNGQILMGANNNSANTIYTPPSVFSNAAPNDWVGFWGDLNNSVAGSITYDIVGVAPARKLVVKFNAVDFWSVDPAVTYQIELNETSNVIDVFLTSVNTISTLTRVVGLETATQGWAAPGFNAGTWSATNQAFRFAPIQAATIQWSGQNIIGSTTGTSIQAVPSTSGYYTCTVTNPLTGCTKVDSVAVNFNVSPSPQIVENDTTLCNPEQIYIHVADNGAYSGGYPSGTTFTWSAIGVPIPDLDSISSSNGSSYSVIVTLPSGCTAGSDTITVLTKSVAVVDVINNATCSGGGSIEVTVTSGLPNYNYVWSTDLAQTNIVRNVTKADNQDTLGNIAAGTYYLQVYDEAGSPASCNSGVLTYVVNGANPIVASVTPTDITCNGNANGAADVTWTGGVAPYSIVWSDGTFADVSSRTIATGGSYSVIVSDLTGCADTVAFAIVEPLPVTVTFTSTPESFSGANDGSITAIPAGGTAPYSILWADEVFTIVGATNPLTGLAAGLYYGLVTDDNGCDNSATVLGDSIRVDVLSNSILKLKLILEGYYDGLGGMQPALLNAGVGVSSTEVDTIVVELRDALSPTTLVESATVVINTNDSVMITLPGSVIGNSYYIAVFHRNAVQTWSDLPVTFTGVTNYDFTTAASQAFASNQIQLAPGVFGFYSGDVNQDEVIDIFDQIDLDNDIFNFNSGYVVTDLTGDGGVDVFDQIIMDNNIFNFIGSSHP